MILLQHLIHSFGYGVPTMDQASSGSTYSWEPLGFWGKITLLRLQLSPNYCIAQQQKQIITNHYHQFYFTKLWWEDGGGRSSIKDFTIMSLRLLISRENYFQIILIWIVAIYVAFHIVVAQPSCLS